MKKSILFCIVFLLVIFCFAGIGTVQAKDEVVVGIWSGPEAEALKKAAQDFEEQTGIRLIVDEIARDAYRMKLSASLMSGAKEWDVLYMIGEWLPEFVKAGNLVSLTDFFTQEEKDKFQDGYKNAILEDELWGLVVGFHTNYYYYRKDLLEEAGFDVPKTWDDFLEVCKALTKDLDGDGKTDIYGSVVRGATKQNSIHYDFANYFLGFGANWLDENYKPVLNSEAGVEALTFFVDLKNKWKVIPPDASAVGYMEKNQYLQAGKVVQIIQWSAAFNTIFSPEESPKIYDKMGVTIIPGKKVGDKIIHASLATSDTWVIPKNVVNRKGAEALIRWLASDKGATSWAVYGGDTTNITPYSDPEILKIRPDFKIASEAMKYAKQFPTIPETAELMETWSKYLGYAFSEKLTPKEALDQCAKEWEKILKEEGYYK